jgi:hypothetical protein
MKFAKWVFRIAGIYGVVVLVPLYFRAAPAEHPEFYYGFIGVALAWQVVFLLMSGDPARYRAVMLPSILEKLAFGIPALILFAQGRLAADMLAAGIIDLVLAVLFFVSWRSTRIRQGV